MKSLLRLSVLLAVVLLGMMVPNTASYRIFTIGDSTVQNYDSGWAPRKGWGQVLQAYFNSDDVEVINRAVGGTSSKSFYNFFWSNVKSEMQAGDFVFIQFGINDRNQSDTARTAYGEVYKDYLRAYVNEARAMGAIPVLVSTVRRNAWNADGTAYGAYHEHPQLTRDVAAEMNVALIDLDAKNKAGMEAVGQAYSTDYWYNHYAPGEYPNYPNGNSDDVHFQEMGAIQLADYVVEGIQELSGDTSVSQLIPFLKPQYEVQVIANHPHAGLITRTETYPSGLNIHIKAIPYAGHTFLEWQDSLGNTVTTDELFQFTMDTVPHTYIGFFDDMSAPTNDCAGVFGGLALVDGCGTCSGGTTGIDPCTDPIQGEDACSIDGVLADTTYGGYVGTGYARLNDSVGSNILWAVNSPAEDSTDMYVQYSNGSGQDLPLSVWVNEVEVGELTFPSTGDSSTWMMDTIKIGLLAGNNSVKLQVKDSAMLPLIDFADFELEGVAAGSCDPDCQGVVAGNAYIDNCSTCVGGTTGLEPCEQDCEGVWGGTKYLDSCGVCIADASEECAGSIQGEDACEVDGIQLESTNGGFVGEGYANTDNFLGAEIYFAIEAAQNISTELQFRFANGGGSARDGEVFLDGVSVGTVNLPATGAWTTWQFSTFTLDIPEGIHNINVVAITSSGLANIDLVGWYDPNLSVGECFVVNSIGDQTQVFTEAYPNPFEHSFKVHGPQHFNYQLTNAMGQLLQQGEAQHTLEMGSQLPAGLYLLQLTSPEGQQTLRLVKQ